MDNWTISRVELVNFSSLFFSFFFFLLPSRDELLICYRISLILLYSIIIIIIIVRLSCNFLRIINSWGWDTRYVCIFFSFKFIVRTFSIINYQIGRKLRFFSCVQKMRPKCYFLNFPFWSQRRTNDCQITRITV